MTGLLRDISTVRYRLKKQNLWKCVIPFRFFRSYLSSGVEESDNSSAVLLPVGPGGSQFKIQEELCGWSRRTSYSNASASSKLFAVSVICWGSK
jgi:hypothetical protein